MRERLDDAGSEPGFWLSKHAVRLADSIVSDRQLPIRVIDIIPYDYPSIGYRAKGRDRAKVMTLATDEFIRRFLIHVLPTGFHRIRHYGLFASHKRAENISRVRELLGSLAPQIQASDPDAADADEPPALVHPCPCCGGRMIIIETFRRGCSPRTHPASTIRIDTS